MGPCLPGPNDTFVCRATVPGVLVYWPVALVLAYAAIATFYVRHSSRRGVGTRVGPYVVVGIVLAVLLAAASLWRAVHSRLPSRGITGQFLTPGLTVADLATPAVAIALALLVLAWVERSWALAAYSVGYLLIVLTDAARVIHSHSVWWFLPQLLIPAALLLLGSARLRPLPAEGRSAMTEHPSNGLDDVAHRRGRLDVLAITHEARRVEFSFLRTTLDLTAGNLAQHLAVLEKAALVHDREGLRGQTATHLGQPHSRRRSRAAPRDHAAQTADPAGRTDTAGETASSSLTQLRCRLKRVPWLAGVDLSLTFPRRCRR